MKLLARIAGIFKPRVVREVRYARPRSIAAKYESAQTGVENKNHWGNADDLGPVSSHSTPVRHSLRRRARYERDNNPHLYAALRTYAHNLIGTGPRLQLGCDGANPDSLRQVERDFAAWAKAVDLAVKLRLMAEARVVDGETFGRLTTNPQSPHPVKLDLRLYETEQVASPTMALSFDVAQTDAINFDGAGNPVTYSFLREHPGDGYVYTAQADLVPARFVLHWFRATRAGQTRGVSELASNLDVGAQTRRYSKAVLTKAEMTANVAGVMETSGAAPDGDAPTVETMEEVDLPRGSLLTLPAGFTAKTLELGATTTGFGEYRSNMLTDLGRPILMPRNLVTGDSSGFNFASGKLDALPFYQGMWIERDALAGPRLLGQLFREWYLEASLVGLIPDDLPALNEWVVDLHWDGFPSINAIDDATAVEKQLANGTTTLAEVCAADGKNWMDVVDQRARELDYMRSKGVAPDQLAQLAMPKPAQPPQADPTKPEVANGV